jgi:hypothetical protein
MKQSPDDRGSRKDGDQFRPKEDEVSTLQLLSFWHRGVEGELKLLHLPGVLTRPELDGKSALLLLVGLRPDSAVHFWQSGANGVELETALFFDGRCMSRNLVTNSFQIWSTNEEFQKPIATFDRGFIDLWWQLEERLLHLYRKYGMRLGSISPEQVVGYALSEEIKVPWLQAAKEAGLLRDLDVPQAVRGLAHSGRTQALSLKCRQLLNAIAERQSDPYGLSCLRYWLTLDTWSYHEGICLLADIDPESMPLGPSAPMNPDLFPFSDELRKPPQLLSEVSPYIDASEYGFGLFFGGDVFDNTQAGRSVKEHLAAYTQRGKNAVAVGRAMESRLNTSRSGLGEPAQLAHSEEKRFAPAQFVNWATSANFKPPWYEWALSQNLIDQRDSPFQVPFFDPDSDAYPELLHIAVRAWEEARKGGEGTPKQRVEAFVEQRYPHILKGPREAIALVANWQKTGGRPKSGG